MATRATTGLTKIANQVIFNASLRFAVFVSSSSFLLTLLARNHGPIRRIVTVVAIVVSGAVERIPMELLCIPNFGTTRISFPSKLISCA